MAGSLDGPRDPGSGLGAPKCKGTLQNEWTSHIVPATGFLSKLASDSQVPLDHRTSTSSRSWCFLIRGMARKCAPLVTGMPRILDVPDCRLFGNDASVNLPLLQQ